MRYLLQTGLVTSRETPDKSKILAAYNKKRAPGRGEFKALASWLPGYAWNQLFHPMSWSAFWLAWGRQKTSQLFAKK